MGVDQVVNKIKEDYQYKKDKHFSIQIKLDYFKDDVLGDSCHLRFVIYDGNLTFTGRTLEEAFQNYSKFDNDFGRHFDMETTVKGFYIKNHQLFFKEFDKVCENLIEAKTVKEQMKLAV